MTIPTPSLDPDTIDCAGALIVREAGGIISDFRGTDEFLDSGNLVAGTPKVYAAMSRLLAPHAKDL